MNRSFQPPDRAAPEMEPISIPLRSMDIGSISESRFLTCFAFWVENVSRDIDNIIEIEISEITDFSAMIH